MTAVMLPKVKTNIFLTMISPQAKRVLGDIYLESDSPFHAGIETVDEFLNHRVEDFFPFHDIERKLVFQINRLNICFLEEPIASNDSLIGPPALITVQSGLTLAVSMIADLPSDHSRLQDYLNLEKRFLVFLKGDMNIYINRNSILRVTEHE